MTLNIGVVSWTDRTDHITLCPKLSRTMTVLNIQNLLHNVQSVLNSIFWSINLDVYTPLSGNAPTSLFARTPVVYKNKAVIFVISKCRSCSNNKLWAYNGSILLSGIPRTAQVEIYKEILYLRKRWGLHAYVPCWYCFTSRLERRELASMNATFTAWKSTSRYRKCVGCQILSAVMA